MQYFSLDYLRCVRCNNKLELDILLEKREVEEGFLNCHNCGLVFPIVMRVPILWDSFSSYIENRRKHGALMYKESKSNRLKLFIKKNLLSAKTKFEDKSDHENHWAHVYQNSRSSKFYTILKKEISKFRNGITLEHGCSVGIISKKLSENNTVTFGIDRSFAAILKAKKNSSSKLDYFVSDSLKHPFGKNKFDAIVALNLLEIIEPTELLRIISKQIKKGSLIVSDPYDNKRGLLSVKKPLTPESLRHELLKHNFKINSNTKNPGFLPWSLKINSRTMINYKVDLVIAKKMSP